MMNRMRKFFTSGQIPIFTVAITAMGTVVASALGAWATAGNRISAIDTKVEVIQERESNHYLELQKSLDEINSKLDRLAPAITKAK